MTKLFVLAGLALTFVSGTAMAATMTSGRPSAVLTKQQCKTVWNAAVPEGRYLDAANAGPYIVNFALADGADQDGRISKREFKKACKKGLVKYPFR